MMWSQILLVACFMLSLFDVGVSHCQKPLCPNGWKYYRNNCYRFDVHGRRTWHEARDYCTAIGSSLVIIDNGKENFWLKFQKVLYGKRFWIGATDILKGREWRWESTAQKVKFTDFHSGQPSNPREHCLELFFNNGQWNDQSCNTKSPYICKKRLEIRLQIYGDKSV